MEEQSKIPVICTVCVTVTERYYDILVNKHLLGVMCDLLNITEADLKRPMNQFMCYRCLYTMEYVHEFRYFALQYIKKGEKGFPSLSYRQPLIFKYIREDTLKEEKLPYCYQYEEPENEKSLLIPRQYELASDPLTVKEYADTVDRFYCSYCPKVFPKNSSLCLHERSHRRKQKQSRSRSRSRSVSTPREYSCAHCSETFPSVRQMKTHTKTHSEKFICRMCNTETFFNNTDRTWHEATCPSRLEGEEMAGPRTRSRSRLGSVSRPSSAMSKVSTNTRPSRPLSRASIKSVKSERVFSKSVYKNPVNVVNIANTVTDVQIESNVNPVNHIKSQNVYPDRNASPKNKRNSEHKRNVESRMSASEQINKHRAFLNAALNSNTTMSETMFYKRDKPIRPPGLYGERFNIPYINKSQITDSIHMDKYTFEEPIMREPRPRIALNEEVGIRPTPQVSRAQILTQERAKIKLREPRFYPCTELNCEFTHQSVDEVCEHEKTVHNKLLWFPCNICRKQYTHGDLLDWHKEAEHPVGPTMCPACDRVFTNINELVNHSVEHFFKCYVCLACDKQMTSKAAIKWHWFEATNHQHLSNEYISIIKLMRGGYESDREEELEEGVTIKYIRIIEKESQKEQLYNVEDDSEFAISEVTSLSGYSRCSTPYRPDSRQLDFDNVTDNESNTGYSRPNTPFHDSDTLMSYDENSLGGNSTDAELVELQEALSPPQFILSDIQTLAQEDGVHIDGILPDTLQLISNGDGHHSSPPDAHGSTQHKSSDEMDIDTSDHANATGVTEEN